MSPPAPSSELGEGTAVGEFKVRRLIAAGPCGAVHAGVHPTLGQMVTIKIVHPQLAGDEQAGAFLQAAERAATLAHPGIVRILASGRLDSGLPFVVAEAAPGQTLAATLREIGRLGVRDLLPLLDALAAILDFAHERGVVHGDLKPENVFVAARPDGRWPPSLQLTDFAMAPLLRPRDGLPAEEGPLAANPHYAPPEQCAGELPDRRADVYALGALAERALSGQPPYAPAEGAAVLRLLREGAPRPAVELPGPATRAFLDQAMAHDPAARYQTMGQLRDALQTLLADAPPAAEDAESATVAVDPALAGASAEPAARPPARPPRSTAKLPRASRRHPAAGLAWAALWLALVGCGAVVAYRVAAGFWPWSRATTPATPGMLEIDTAPPGAVVYVDRKPWHRRTPVSIPVTRGRAYELYVHKPEHLPWRQQVSLGVQEASRQLRIKLVKATRWGTLLITTNRKADIFLDGRRVGTQTTEVTLAEVRAEVDHALRIVAPGFRIVNQTVRVEAGKVGVFRFPLVRVDTPRGAE